MFPKVLVGLLLTLSALTMYHDPLIVSYFIFLISYQEEFEPVKYYLSRISFLRNKYKAGRDISLKNAARRGMSYFSLSEG